MNSILEPVNEGGSLKLDIDVTDLNRDSTVPTAFTWTLSDAFGDVINSLEDVSETPAATVSVVLAGDDLQIIDDCKKMEKRLFTVQTDTGDADEPQTIEYEFWLRNLVVINA